MRCEKCEVISNTEISSGIFEMVIKNSEMAAEAQPGQFLHIRPCSGMEPLLRRPISICRNDKGKGLLTIVYQVVGRGTKILSEIKAGDYTDVMGPLGKGFPVFDGKNCAVVGGGIGTAPLLELATNIENCDAYLGFRSQPHKIQAFAGCCNEVFVSTEDGSTGHKGYVTELLAGNIKKYDVVYTCGPAIMMKKVKELCAEAGVECYVSLEERMGCGIGACLVCACKTEEKDGSRHYKKACADGPVFRAEEVLFDE